MTRTKVVIGFATVLVCMVVLIGYLLTRRDQWSATFQTAAVVRREIRAIINTNGVIEPVDGLQVVAPFDGFVTVLTHQEGDWVEKGALLVRVESDQLNTALASAKAALLQARRQGQAVLAGPSREELASIDGSIAEAEMQLKKQREDLQREENLLKHEATSRVTVENLRDQVKLLEVHRENLVQKRQNLLNRYSLQEKSWESEKISALEHQVDLLTRQVESGALRLSREGRIYSLNTKPGAFVHKGQVLMQIYEPGHVRAKVYVDEPDLGRIEKGELVEIEWDGLPEKHWLGRVTHLPQQIQTLGNRSVGYVFCTLEGDPAELIPNINIKAQIVTGSKANALVVPRASVFNSNGNPVVLVLNGGHPVMKSVILGMVTPQEVEILRGIEPGNQVITNPGEVGVP